MSEMMIDGELLLIVFRESIRAHVASAFSAKEK